MNPDYQKEENIMTEYLFGVEMKHKTTGERIKLMVWAENVDEATHKITGVIGGYNGEYAWTGSGPKYNENGKIISREV